MKVTLIKKQKQELKIHHDTTRDGRVRDRIKAVIQASNGWNDEEIANALLIHEATVRQHIKALAKTCHNNANSRLFYSSGSFPSFTVFKEVVFIC